MAKLTLGQEAYYEQQVAGGLDDYHAGRGESPGIWAGRAADGLGLVGVVGDGDLGTLLRGVNPANEARLRSPVRERTITVRALDVESGEWREEQKRLAPVAGFDLVFSCPKSVSMLHALTDDERVRREISEAHEQAWQAALAYLEREACVVRRGHGGAIREHGAGFVAAAFRHRTSRAQDPHLHTHVTVANMTRGADGVWRALDGEAILKTYRLAAGYLYEAQLRHEPSRRLGLEWTEPVKGMAELERVPEQAIRAFSTRRQSLVEHMQALGIDGFAAARVAALATREAKEPVELPRLREEWKARAAEHGLGRRQLETLVRDRPLPPPLLEREQLGLRMLGPDGLTAKQTTFTMAELVQAVAGSVPQGASVDELLETAQELSRLRGVQLVEPGEQPGRPARFTTGELLALERDAVELALAGRGADAPRPDEKLLLRTLITAEALTNEQRHLVRSASLSRDRVVCVVGVAGTGKTTALRALADAHRASGVAVLGAAASGRATDELQAATGIASRTTHRLLLDAREQRLPPRCVLVVDEAGMAETRVLAPILRLVDQAGGKAILVGDPQQLPAVGAGGLFPALSERLGTVELTRNRRQLDRGERAALARLRAGDPEPYLAHAASHGRLHIEDDEIEDDEIAAKQRLLVDWWRVAEHDLAGTVMLAYRREDVRELNEAAHALMLQAGRLGPQALTLGEHEFRLGDRIVCRRNEPRLGLRNGMRGSIVDLDPTAETLTLRTGAGALRRLPFGYAAEHLDHAYALTGHAAQGATVDRAYVLLRDEGALREWGYVACSRARTATRLYLMRDALERDQHARTVDKRGLPARLAGALERSAAEELALAQAQPAPSEATRRAWERRRRQCERALELAERRLAIADEKVSGVGRFGRRRQRIELQAEVSRQRTAVRLAHKQLASLPLEPPEPRPAPTRRQLDPAPLLRARVREREQDRGLER